MNRGDVYMVDLEPTAGHEQRGHRPVVVVSTERFNRLTSCPIILPVTHGGEFAGRAGFTVTLTGTQTTGLVRCDQPRTLDLTARNGRKVESLPATVMNEVLAKVAVIFE
jgi:mRNA interferase ChpB